MKISLATACSIVVALLLNFLIPLPRSATAALISSVALPISIAALLSSVFFRGASSRSVVFASLGVATVVNALDTVTRLSHDVPIVWPRTFLLMLVITALHAGVVLGVNALLGRRQD